MTTYHMLFTVLEDGNCAPWLDSDTSVSVTNTGAVCGGLHYKTRAERSKVIESLRRAVDDLAAAWGVDD